MEESLTNNKNKYKPSQKLTWNVHIKNINAWDRYNNTTDLFVALIDGLRLMTEEETQIGGLSKFYSVKTLKVLTEEL